MSLNHHENLFVERMQFVVGDAELAQELSIPRKARRLDLVCRFDKPPEVFGALQEHCADRTVLFEHESQPLAGHAVASAWLGMAWLLWERVRPQRRRGRSSTALRDPTSRPPLAIVIADRASKALRGAVPTLRPQRIPGLWLTADLDDGGLIVVDTSRVRAADGLALWSWLGRAPNDAAQAARLASLIDDPTLPITQRASLQEAIVSGQLAASAMEQETVAQRIRREARADGERDGRAQGIRASMLELVKKLAPERLQEFEAIVDPNELQRAALALVRR